MSIREKVKQQLDHLTDEELRTVSQMINQLNSSDSVGSSRKKRSLKPRNFGGKLDEVSLRDIAYD